MVKKFLFIWVLSLFCSSLKAQDLSAGLIGYYRLGVNNGYDFSMSGYNGTAYNVTKTTDLLGFTDSASSFNGSNSYISIGNISNLGFTSGDFSVCAKFRTTSTGVNNLAEKVSFTGPNGVADYGWAFGDIYGKLHFIGYTGIDKSSGPPNWYELTSTININDGKWHSAVITYDASLDTMKMYIDCMFEAKIYCPTSPAANNANLCIGRREVTNNLYWNGGIDEFRFYNRALTYSEARIYSQNINQTSPLGKDTTLCNFPVLLNAKNKGLRYQWSTGDTLQTIFVSDTGYYWVDIYGLCTSYRDSLHIKGVNLPPLFIGNDTLICPGDSLKLQSNITGSTYTWSTGSAQNNIWVKSSGTYSVAVVTSCGIKYDTITISSFAYSLGQDTTICNKDSIKLSGPPGAMSYLWSNGDTLSAITVKDSGEYNVQANFPCGVVRDTIIISKLPVLSIGYDTVVCGLFSKQLKSNAVFSDNLWSTGDTTSSLSITDPGIYWLRVSDKCGFQYDTISVADIQLELGADRILCSVTDSQILTTPMAADSVIWSDGSKARTYTAKSKGIHWVRVYSKCGIISDTIRLYQKSDFLLPKDSTVCDLSNINFTLSVPHVSGFQYQWSTGINDTFSSKNISDTGLYILSIFANCGILIDSFKLKVHDEPLQIDTLYSCSFPIIINAKRGLGSYYWNGSAVSGSDSNIVTIPGKYYLKVQTNGCFIYDSITVLLLKRDTADIIGDTAVCFGTKVVIRNNYSNKLKWGVNPIAASSIEIIPTASGWYYARTTDTLTCPAQVDSIFIKVISPPIAGFTFSPDGGNVPVSVSFTNTSSGATKWTWFVNNRGDSAHTENWSYHFDDTLASFITLVAVNEQGCRDSITQKVPLWGEFFLRIPNAFTPNSDGLNDSFRIEYNGIDSFSYAVYNRWGQHIFETSSPNIQWWDGTFKGQRVPEGAYFLIVMYQRLGEQKKIINGTITILR